MGKYSTKQDILKDFPELTLAEFGDFVIKSEYIEGFEIIDFHCHLYQSLKSFMPKIFRKSSINFEVSFFDLSCFPISLKYFDFEKELLTTYPNRLLSLGGLKLAYEISGLGGFISALRKSTPERMLRDMKLNNISKSVVLQLSTPSCDSSDDMKEVISRHDEFITFGCIHPDEEEVQKKIDKNISNGVMGWKTAPHVTNIDIDDEKSILVIKQLSETKLPIISCSGVAFPKERLKELPARMKKNMKTQELRKFNNVLKEIPDMTFIFAHGGIYETDELIELMKLYPNTYTDISTQPPSKIKKLIEEVGSQRLLFGTDYPAFNHAFPIVSVLRATEKLEERRNIFSENAKRILKI